MISFSVLDLSPIVEGGSVSAALRNTLDLAQHCERWDYQRYWLAEHHATPDIASAATVVLMTYVAGGTNTIRVGSGGIMLPNHSPLVVAEQFGTLAALYPGRIDLGLGRSTGSNPATARALGHGPEAVGSNFASDIERVQDYLSEAPRQLVPAIPGRGSRVPLWILGSSLIGARHAARFGLPFSFASQFAPLALAPAVKLYRDNFQPSSQLSEPYVMLGYNVVVADCDQEAQYLASSQQQAMINRQRGTPSQLPRPMRDFRATLGEQEGALLDIVLSCSAVGAPETVRSQLQAFIDHMAPDELIVTSQIHDHQARLRSFDLLATLRRDLIAAR